MSDLLPHRNEGWSVLTKEEAEARVAKGAAHLDRVWPGWAARIDVGTLALSSCVFCVIGQLSGGDYTDVLTDFELGAYPEHYNADHYGFDISEDGDMSDFKRLQDAWVAAIADRRLSPATGKPATLAAVDRLVACSGS